MSVRPADVRTQAETLLREETALLNTLESLLKQEAGVLRSDDANAIEHIGASRHGCTSSLARLAAEREQSCQLLSFKRGRDGFEQLLRWCDPTGLLLDRWNSNLVIARRCRDLNDRNGAVVTVKLNHVQNLLAAMRGEKEQPVYSPQRRVAALLPARELGTA